MGVQPKNPNTTFRALNEELADTDEATAENIQDDLDESANLSQMRGSHFKVTLREAGKELRTKTQQYFGSKDAPDESGKNAVKGQPVKMEYDDSVSSEHGV